MAKAAKKRAKKSAPPKSLRLRKVPEKDYALCWDPGCDQCHFGHKSGIGGPVGSGMCDVVEVFSAGGKYYVLSLNYAAPYACIEAFADTDGVESLIFAEPKDMKNIFGEDLAGLSPKKIAERLAGEM